MCFPFLVIRPVARAGPDKGRADGRRAPVSGKGTASDGVKGVSRQKSGDRKPGQSLHGGIAALKLCLKHKAESSTASRSSLPG